MIHHRGMMFPALIAAGLLAAACASAPSPATPGSKTAAQVLPAMKTAVQSAQSVRISGSGQDGTQKITFDMNFVGKNDMSGTFTENGATLTVEVVNGATYLKVNQDFLNLAKLPAALCSTVCGKYVELPAAESSQITGAISLSALTQHAFNAIPSSAANDTVDHFVPGTLNGQPVLTAHGDGNTIDVASTGTPYPLLITTSSGDNITFSEWNSVPPLTPPPAAEIISLTSL
jgi:hypothetical protein